MSKLPSLIHNGSCTRSSTLEEYNEAQVWDEFTMFIKPVIKIVRRDHELVRKDTEHAIEKKSCLES